MGKKEDIGKINNNKNIYKEVKNRNLNNNIGITLPKNKNK